MIQMRFNMSIIINSFLGEKANWSMIVQLLARSNENATITGKAVAQGGGGRRYPPSQKYGGNEATEENNTKISVVQLPNVR